MIDLGGSELRSLAARLKRLRLARDAEDRNAIIAATESAAAFQASNTPAPPKAPRPSKTPIAQSALPITGPRPISPANEQTLADEEWRMSKPGAATGGRITPAATGLIPALAPAAGRPAVQPPTAGADAVPRSPAIAKVGLATGSQAAVVKLASYGAGPVRAGALLNYQSDKGQNALEREDGTLVIGKEAVADLAAHWRGESTARAPSNDVLSFTIFVEGEFAAQDARAGLAEVLKGHAYAWRSEPDGADTRLHVVSVAASKHRNANGKLERIFANEKSLNSLYDKIDEAFGRDADFGPVQWAHGVDGATAQLARLSKGGKLDAETSAGRSIAAEADRLFQQKPSNANREKSEGFNPNLQLAKSWQPSMRSTASRDFAHIILSAKPGTDKDAFLDAARATLAKEFAGHEYVFALHTNRQHIHVHAAVRLTRDTGQKLHPGIQDFNRWRETLAEEARERNIPMEAVRRFDQAHAPGYKLKDIKMVERGVAPESVRRRVERVERHEIHRPTREEGKKRAQDAARQWTCLAQRNRAGAMPALAPGAMRLYRIETTTSAGAYRAVLFTNERSIAEGYAKPGQPTRLVYLDVPAARLAELKPSRSNPGKVFIVPRALSSMSQPFGKIDEASILPFQQRAEAALSPRREQPLSINAKKDMAMRTAETMTTAKRGMADAISRIGALLPEGDMKAALEKQSSDLLDSAQRAIEAQAALEEKPAEIEGNKYVRPEPVENLGSIITHERKGSEIHYHRHDANTGALQTLAFIDKGKQLDVCDWNNADSVNAALKVAAQKWDTITIKGSDAYKETAARLAAEHGYKITNPEMQDRIRELRTEIEGKRATMAEGRPETKQPAPEAPAKSQAHGDGSILNTTPAERSIELQSIRHRVDQEAKREIREAAAAKVAHETNAATTSEATPYRSSEEAHSAREAERAVDNNPARPIPSDPAQSESIQALRHEQRKVLSQEELDQRRIDRENADRVLREERQPKKTESDGESMG